VRATERTGVNFFNKEKDEDLDHQIAAIYKEMDDLGADHEDYPKMLGLLERCMALKANKRRATVSRDTLANIAGNLLGILMIVAYERGHATTSKGFQFIRPKN
jgi:hypothetical protein